MEIISAARDLLGMGSDAAIVALALAVWKIDRRLLKLELRKGE